MIILKADGRTFSNLAAIKNILEYNRAIVAGGHAGLDYTLECVQPLPSKTHRREFSGRPRKYTEYELTMGYDNWPLITLTSRKDILRKQ